jgi:glycosyltransferase involved in cell wall biosynthesis
VSAAAAADADADADAGRRPLVSAVLASRRPAFVGGAVAMLRAQTYPALEIVVVLHGFGRAHLPADAARSLGASARVVEAPASWTLGRCLNAGVAASRGAVLAKVDDDDLYGPSYLDEAVAALEAGRGDVVGKTEMYVYLARSRELLLWHPGASRLHQDHVAGGTLLFPRALGERPGFRDVNRSEDTLFLDDCQRLGRRVYATSRRRTKWRRLDGEGHHTWDATDELFRPASVVVRRDIEDDSPAGLLRLIGAG